MSGFIHLHVASAFSGHFGVTRPEIMVEAAASRAENALAITDRDGLYGAIKHIGACIKVGISPIVGVDLEVLDDNLASLGRAVVLSHGHDGGLGWSALCAIVSAAHRKTRKLKAAGITRTELANLAVKDGVSLVTVLVGNDSDVGEAALTGDRLQTASRLLAWRKAFAATGSLAIEITSHLTEPGTPFCNLQANRLLQLADSMGIPTVLTNAVRYLEPDDAITADVLDAARHLEPLGMFRPQPNAQAWLKPKETMHQLAIEITQDSGRAKQLLETTSALAERCRLNPVGDCGWGKPKTPEKSTLGIDGNPFEVLWQKANGAIEWRYPRASDSQLATIRHRLSQELITINRLGFATYFLTVADVTQMIRDMKIRIAARGSGAGSLTNYLLGISGVDPIEHELLFERFLSTERSSLPDIDIDVESATVSYTHLTLPTK
jgi:error-prone DNA polymerase